MSGTAKPARQLLHHLRVEYNPQGEDFYQLLEWLAAPRCRSRRIAEAFPRWAALGPTLLKRFNTQQKLVLRELAAQLLRRCTEEERAGVLRYAEVHGPPGQARWSKQQMVAMVHRIRQLSALSGVEIGIPEQSSDEPEEMALC